MGFPLAFRPELSQWRVIVEAIECLLLGLSPSDRELVNGLSARAMRAG